MGCAFFPLHMASHEGYVLERAGRVFKVCRNAAWREGGWVVGETPTRGKNKED